MEVRQNNGNTKKERSTSRSTQVYKKREVYYENEALYTLECFVMYAHIMVMYFSFHNMK